MFHHFESSSTPAKLDPPGPRTKRAVLRPRPPGLRDPNTLSRGQNGACWGAGR